MNGIENTECSKKRHMNGQRENAVDNVTICDISHLSSRQRNKLAFLARCRATRNGTFRQYVEAKKATTSPDDRQALRNRYCADVSIRPPDRTLCGEIKRQFSGDTLKELYTGDKTALNASCAKRKRN
jgi:hypothetical protein